jgi:hypothetical protein
METQCNVLFFYFVFLFYIISIGSCCLFLQYVFVLHRLLCSPSVALFSIGCFVLPAACSASCLFSRLLVRSVGCLFILLVACLFSRGRLLACSLGRLLVHSVGCVSSLGRLLLSCFSLAWVGDIGHQEGRFLLLTSSIQ